MRPSSRRVGRVGVGLLPGAMARAGKGQRGDWARAGGGTLLRRLEKPAEITAHACAGARWDVLRISCLPGSTGAGVEKVDCPDPQLEFRPEGVGREMESHVQSHSSGERGTEVLEVGDAGRPGERGWPPQAGSGCGPRRAALGRPGRIALASGTVASSLPGCGRWLLSSPCPWTKGSRVVALGRLPRGGAQGLL